MRINNIGYLIKEGIRGIFLHGFMSFAAICVTVACLLIVGTFSSLVYNVNMIVERLNRTNEISVWIDMNLTESDAKSVGTKINMIENVQNAVFTPNHQVLEDYAAKQENPEAFSGMEPSDVSHLFTVTLMDNERMEETVAELEKLEGVVRITAAYELADGFSALQRVLQIFSVVVISVLLMVSLLIISNTVKLGMYDRKDEISIMKMVGATNSFIRLPFVVEGFTLGMIGAAVAFGLEWLLYDFVMERLALVEGLGDMLSFAPFQMLLIPMVVTFAAAGLFVGIVGSWTSIRKFMDV